MLIKLKWHQTWNLSTQELCMLYPLMRIPCLLFPGVFIFVTWHVNPAYEYYSNRTYNEILTRIATQEKFKAASMALNSTRISLHVVSRIINTLWSVMHVTFRSDFFYVSLTMDLSITLANDQVDAQIFNTFITILYMYIFRAISCLSWYELV